MRVEGVTPKRGPLKISHVTCYSKDPNDLTDDLLEYARLGKKPVERRTVNLTTMARRLADETVPTCHCGKATIEVEDGFGARPPLGFSGSRGAT